MQVSFQVVFDRVTVSPFLAQITGDGSEFRRLGCGKTVNGGSAGAQQARQQAVSAKRELGELALQSISNLNITAISALRKQ